MALLIWMMIIPMLVKIDFAALGQVTQNWRGIGITLFINWAVTGAVHCPASVTMTNHQSKMACEERNVVSLRRAPDDCNQE